MNKRDLTLLVVALIFGLMAALLVSKFLRQATHKGEQFVVAVGMIAKGEAIEEKHVKLSDPIQNASADELFLQTKDVIGKIAAEDVKRGALIRRQEVAAPVVEQKVEKRKTLPIPPGLSAFEITIKDVVHLPGLIDIGTFVDIVGEVATDNAHGQMRTVVYSSQVLSTSEGEDKALKSFSIGVMPEEAESLAAAISLGKVQIILRSEPGDKPRFTHTGGVMEVIRGVQQAQTVTFTSSGRLWKGKFE